MLTPTHSVEEVEIALLPGQLQMVNLPDPNVDLDICCYQGGYGSGKTRGGVELGLLLAEFNPGTIGLVCGETFPLVRDTTLATYFEVLDDYGYVDGRDYIWKASDKVLLFPKWGNSAILFRHLEKPRKLKSLNLGWVHMEEMSEVNEPTFMMLISRLRHKRMRRHRLFGTTNPQASKGWIWEHFVKNGGIKEEEIDGRKVRINYRRVLAPSTQNKHLSAAYLLNMRNTFDPDYYRINVLGEDGDYTSGLVVKGWSDLNEVETPFRPELKVHITCDFNVDPMCWGFAHVIGTKPGEYEFHFFDELAEEHTTTLECVDRFFERYPPDKVKAIEINGDASGNQHRTEAQKYNDTNYKIMQTRLSQLGYRNVVLNVRPANPMIVDRIAAFNAAVCNKEGIRRVFINPKKCKWLLYNVHNLMFKEGRSEIKLPTDNDIKQDPKAKFLGHPFDAKSYLIEKYDPIALKVKREKDTQPPEVVFDV